jgi:ABC-2 type transport system ATP-binding protein
MQNAAIIADKLIVSRQGKPVLRELTFALEPGKITGLIGPSGSGKTTLMRSIVGAQTIRSGSLRVLGEPAGSARLRKQIGYVTQSPSVYQDLTVRQNVRYFAAILGQPKARIAEVLEQVDLMPQRDQLVGSLSGGQCARVSLAVALLGDAQLLVLDEPTVGLDPVLRRRLWKLFAQLATEGRTLLISSHVMDEAEQCPNLLLLRDGRVLSHGPKQQLLAQTGSKTVEDAFLQLVTEGGSLAS